MRCKREPSSELCERCVRKSIECVFEKHRRGRKPGTRIIKKRQEQTLPDDVSLLYVPEVPLPQDELATEHNNHDHASIGATRHYPSRTIWDDTNALQPTELLNKNAKTGKFSLRNVLSTANDDDDNPEIGEAGKHGSDHTAMGGIDPTSLDDPVHCEILNFPIALGLFNSFMRSLNPFISQFDPQLHTFEYVQQKSSFLLTVILAAAASAFHPPLHAKLRDHAENLLARSFMKGTKSPEMIQGILVSTYWKEPDDTRSWLLVGFAIRMAIELGWHKLQAENATGKEMETEAEIRVARNLRRTWLILFVYDRR